MIKLLTALLMLIPSSAAAVTLKHDTGEIKTNRVLSLAGTVDGTLLRIAIRRIERLKSMTGDLLLIIDTDGGHVNAGQMIVDNLRKALRPGEKLICYVDGHAHSMGFNILTHCDERYGAPGAAYLFHDIAYPPEYFFTLGRRITPSVLRGILLEFERMNDYYSSKNSAALDMPRSDYDAISKADQTYWDTDALVKRKYLKSKATITR